MIGKHCLQPKNKSEFEDVDAKLLKLWFEDITRGFKKKKNQYVEVLKCF